MPIPDGVELQTPQKKEWPLIPADVYQAEITDIEYKSEPNRYKKYPTDPDEKQYMNFEFTIIEEGPLYGRKVWQKMSMIKPYPPQQSGKATWVYRLATAMAGHPITKDGADKFTSSDINDYIHRQVRVNIIQSPPDNNGKIWNNIDGFMAVKQQLPMFDEAKVPKDTPNEAVQQPQPVLEPAQPQAPQNQSGHEKARAMANSLAGGNRPVETAVEPSGGYEDINVEDIPF